ncbi:ComEC/Rec2 family competence protein [Acidovorax sp. NPDC077693]|uniref:ComEC/Rec2 family competence protein n=1 Tax=unclassified Acidovorax TaxID=2684926 RepID=UPI0037C66BB1
MPLALHFLDMGDRPYGDAILVRLHGKTILVDGGHRGDQVRGRRTPAFQDQIAACLKTELPVSIDLLVITHCHSDHIGCLPEVISSGDLIVKAALVADEKLGFGRGEKEPPFLSDDPVVAKVVAALREEPISTGRADKELAEFLEDAVRLEDRYLSLLALFESQGIELARCGVDEVEDFPKKLNLRDLSVIAPSQEQLLRCAGVISRSTERALDAVAHLRSLDGDLSAIELYREVARPALNLDFHADAAGKGAALNDQSLLIIAGAGKNKCLLTGDMQFSSPDVQGISREMSRLRKRVEDAGPYALVKLPHHGSYNGVDESVLDEWKAKALVITTGRGHPAHPSASTLELLQNTQEVKWARTDKNGLISAAIRNGQTTFTIASGILDDSSPNQSPDNLAESLESQLEAGLEERVGTSEVAASETTVGGPQTHQVAEFVEVITRVPNKKTRVTITIDIDPAVPVPAVIASPRTAPIHRAPSDKARIFAAGRKLPPLLFVTNRTALLANVGEATMALAERFIRDAGHELMDVQNSSTPWEKIRGRSLVSGAGAHGVVLLGGHDVVPSVRQDVLPPHLRSSLGSEAQTDPDHFYVWSDDIYGDTDGDQIAELPVSRIPDGRSADFFLKALAASPAQMPAKKGVRNHARPFADGIFASAGGRAGDLLVSNPHLRSSLNSTHLALADLYFMLHGSDSDGTTFWGESDDGDFVEAISVDEICAIEGSTVFSGCCWGALTVNGLAHVPGGPPSSRQIDHSLALTCLFQGANAFVGCTGAHYSPRPGQRAFGAPMHEYFWHHFAKTQAPAKALFEAKKEFRKNMFHDAPSDLHKAVEHKILDQFTCLGLAW